jgi:hypothetical protein
MPAPTLNRAWHESHRMPVGATMDQRIAWHRAHAAACACRPIPEGVAKAMEARGLRRPRRTARR